jgi:crotonobetainyl-CoA:carnitine CoA-transferase CaiB-like acyl-CoA transferase
MLPLAGLKVLDLSRVLAGPVCGQILADLGADVVKVERPGIGDDTRHWGPPFTTAADGSPDQSAYFLSCNRGKRSLALDLSQPEGRAVLDDLLRTADVMLENFLPDAVAKLGLSPERLRQINPRLVSCSISGFGRTGPLAGIPGYDLAIQAASGLMAITGEPDGRPMKVGVAISDVVTGLYAAVSVLSGLVARSTRSQDSPAAGNSSTGSSTPGTTGEGNGTAGGRAFDVALFDCTLASLVNVAQSTLVTGNPAKRYGNAHSQIVPYESFATADGHLVLAVGADRQWERFCNAIGRADWFADPRFRTNPDRVAHRGDLVPLLTALFSTRSTAAWLELLTAADVPHARIAGVDEALASPQATARAMVVEAPDETGQTLRLVGSPIHWPGRPEGPVAAPPRLGRHTDEILREWLNYGSEQIAALRQVGTVE